MGSESDKRDTERVHILGGLQGEIMVFEPLQIKEISRGGASVETLFPLSLNSLHELRLTLGTKSVVLNGRGGAAGRRAAFPDEVSRSSAAGVTSNESETDLQSAFSATESSIPLYAGSRVLCSLASARKPCTTSRRFSAACSSCASARTRPCSPPSIRPLAASQLIGGSWFTTAFGIGV